MISKFPAAVFSHCSAVSTEVCSSSSLLSTWGNWDSQKTNDLIKDVWEDRDRGTKSPEHHLPLSAQHYNCNACAVVFGERCQLHLASSHSRCWRCGMQHAGQPQGCKSQHMRRAPGLYQREDGAGSCALVSSAEQHSSWCFNEGCTPNC